MGIVELFIIGVGLSMDAFAVAVCKGLSMKKMNYRNALVTGLFFGGFQAIMPLAGYFLGSQLTDYITSVDHWIAFALLSIIGIGMIRESRRGGNGCGVCEGPNGTDDQFSLKNMTALALATSIDALAVGVTFAFLQVDIVPAALLIGIITFVLSFIGVKIGNVFGAKFEAKSELTGGIILIGMGVKILIDHLG